MLPRGSSSKKLKRRKRGREGARGEINIPPPTACDSCCAYAKEYVRYDRLCRLASCRNPPCQPGCGFSSWQLTRWSALTFLGAPAGEQGALLCRASLDDLHPLRRHHRSTITVLYPQDGRTLIPYPASSSMPVQSILPGTPIQQSTHPVATELILLCSGQNLDQLSLAHLHGPSARFSRFPNTLQQLRLQRCSGVGGASNHHQPEPLGGHVHSSSTMPHPRSDLPAHQFHISLLQLPRPFVRSSVRPFACLSRLLQQYSTLAASRALPRIPSPPSAHPSPCSSLSHSGSPLIPRIGSRHQ